MKDDAELVEREGLYARNWAFIDASLQKKLGTQRLLFAGTGLGSMIARAAAQTGFQRFILADGDVVERSNLNRQDFTGAQIGQNKAEAIAQMLQSIQPHAEIEVIPRYLTPDDFPSLVARSDLIVNTIDLDNPAFLALNRITHAQQKYCLFPMNLGWGGSLLVFSPRGITLDEYLTLDDPERDPSAAVTDLIGRVVLSLPGGVPNEVAHVLRQFQERTSETWPYDPQLGIASHLTAAICARAAVALTAGEPVREAPDVIWVNAYDAVAPLLIPDVAPLSGDVSMSASALGEMPASHPFSRVNVEQRILNLAQLAQRMPPDERSQPIMESSRDYTAVFRPGTALTIITASHIALTDSERTTVSKYRLEQYIAAGMYDTTLIERYHISDDPAMEMLGARDTHIIIADANGVIAAYLCLQAASDQFLPRITVGDPSRSGDGSANEQPRILQPSSSAMPLFPMVSEPVRRGFPVESEYGELYLKHAGIRYVPVDNVREISRLVRNLSLKRLGPDAVADLATVETILASVRYVLDPKRYTEVVIGCIAPEARRFLHHLGIPVAYAPAAPIKGENLGGAAPDGPSIWADASHEPGKFWPFAIACAELRNDRAYFEQLEEAMSRESVQIVRREMNEARKLHPHPRSRYASYTEVTEGTSWVDLDQ